MDSNTSLKKNFILNVLLTLSTILFPLITFPYVSRVIGPAADAAFHDFPADKQDKHRHDKARKILIPRVTVGVLLVGGFFGELEPKQADYAG